MNAGPLDQLLDECRNLIGLIPALAAFTPPFPASLPRVDGAATSLPNPGMLDTFAPLVTKETAALVASILQAAPLLNWQQSYTKSQVGAAYLMKYGWFNLVSPEGVFACETVRISVGVWDRGLTYPRHWHEPEEAYLVLAGGAVFHSEGRPPRQCLPGDVVIHGPDQPHSMDMTNSPLMALAIWKGPSLLRKPTLKA